MPPWLLILGLIGVVVGIIRVYVDTRQKPHYPPLHASYIPFFGKIFEFAMPESFLMRNKERFGSIFRCKILGRWMTFIVHPEHNKTFYLSNNDTFSPRETYEVMTPIFGKNCVYDAPYAKMREQLNFAAVPMKISNFQNYVPLIAESVTKYCREQFGKEAEINLLEEFGTMIVQTASRCLLGPEVSEMIEAKRFSTLLEELELGINPLGVFYPSLPSPGARTRDRARKEMAGILESIIERRNSENSQASDMVNALRQGIYRDGTQVPLDEQVGVLIGAMFAGQHTSLITSTWTTLYLAAREDLREELRKERADRMEATCDSELSYEQINESEFAEACVKEALRKHPPLIMLMRKVKKDTRVGEYTVPKGDIIVAAPLASMRSPDIFVNPNDFDPHRFMEGREEQKATEYAFSGFGAGAHRCLGEKFGLMQTKTIVSTLFDLYDIELLNGSVPDPDFTALVVGPKKKQCKVRLVARRPDMFD